jgi:hypothetical protein
MKFHLDAVDRAVQTYLATGDAQQRTLLKKAEASFERALADYQQLMSGERSRELSQQASQRYARYRSQARGLFSLRDAQLVPP